MYDQRSIPVCRIKHKRLILFNLPVQDRQYSRHKVHENASAGLRVAYKDGTLSTGAKKRLKNAIETLIDISPKKRFTAPSTGIEYAYQIVFVTLTLSAPQGQYDDATIVKECLRPFLQTLRRTFKCSSYVWRAEKQKNGNIHFHLTTNNFIPMDQLQQQWNRCQERLGFVTAFKSKHGHSHPPSTEVKSVRHIKSLSDYLIKYMSKATPDKLRVNCKQWDCSKELKSPNYVDKVVDSVVDATLTKLKEIRGVVEWVGDCYTCIKMRGFDIRSYLPKEWQEEIRSVLDTIRLNARLAIT